MGRRVKQIYLHSPSLMYHMSYLTSEAMMTPIYRVRYLKIPGHFDSASVV
jgi:hypothetical protein